MSDRMSRDWILGVAACGAVDIRKRGTKMREGLPVFTTATEEEAKILQVTHCRLERDGSGIYRLNEPPGDVSELDKIGAMFEATYARLLASRSGVAR